MSETCERCGAIIEIGDWPLCDDGTGKHGHAPPHGMLGAFKPYINTTVGERPIEVTSYQEHKNLFKTRWKDDHEIRFVERDGLHKADRKRGSGTPEKIKEAVSKMKIR